MEFHKEALLQPLWLSVQLACLTTLFLLLFTTPIAWWLARSKSKLSLLIEATLSMPLVLPPSVLGFYLLMLLSPAHIIGKWWLSITNNTLVFNFGSIFVGSCLYSLPFVMRALKDAFSNIDESLLEAATILGASALRKFTAIVIPLSWTGYLSAIILGFSHTLGEFGIVLMLGGNIPGKTRTISIAIYDAVEQMQYREAYILSAILIGFSFCVLFFLTFVMQRKK